MKQRRLDAQQMEVETLDITDEPMVGKDDA